MPMYFCWSCASLLARYPMGTYFLMSSLIRSGKIFIINEYNRFRQATKNNISMRKKQTNTLNTQQAKIFAEAHIYLAKTEPNEIGWQTAAITATATKVTKPRTATAATTTETATRWLKSFVKSICIGNRQQATRTSQFRIIQNAANKSKLTNTNLRKRAIRRERKGGWGGALSSPHGVAKTCNTTTRHPGELSSFDYLKQCLSWAQMEIENMNW